MEKNNFNLFLKSPNPEEILKYLEDLYKKLNSIREEEKINYIEEIFTLFYLDLFDKPNFKEVIEKAMEILVKMAKDEKSILWLCSQLKETDLKATLNLARVLGKIGKPAIIPLIETYKKEIYPYSKAMALHALSKIREKEVLNYIDEVIEATKNEDGEIRDTAVRSLGKFFENFEKEDFTKEIINKSFLALMNSLGDEKAPVRAKAFRSLGKMVKKDLLEEEQREKIREKCNNALGKKNFQWDPAYIVRLEAEETLKALKT